MTSSSKIRNLFQCIMMRQYKKKKHKSEINTTKEMLCFVVFLLLVSKLLCECPQYSLEWNSECLTFYSNGTQFLDAELICKKSGGYLASVHDGFKNALLAQEAKWNFSESTETDFWVGATNLMATKDWNWTDGTKFDFNEWQKGEPQNISGLNCAAESISNGYWTAQDCFKNKPFVCSISSEPNYPIFANCTPGWFYLASTHSCYGTQWGGFNASWTAANANCEKLTAILPPMHSLAEFQLITSLVTYHNIEFWIGIFSVDGGNIWKNSDGSFTDFLKYGKWCADSPKNATGERCVTIGLETPNYSCYRDYECYSRDFMSLCKKTILL